MRTVAIAFVLGVAGAQQWAELPWSAGLAVAVVLIGLGLARWVPILRALAMVAVGFAWAVASGQQGLASRLSPELAGTDVAVWATVRDLPRSADPAVRFVADLESEDGRWDGTLRARLSWYESGVAIRAGQRWPLRVRLRPPSGFANPAGFDYERWLFARGIDALGYVRGRRGEPSLADDPSSRLQRLRAWLYQHQKAALQERRFAGIVHALTVGVRTDISTAQWRVLRQTGTAHLMAISGLHVGLVAAAGFFFGRRTLRGSAWLTETLSAPRVGALGAMLFAASYAALAGFSLPTQRAFIMVAIWALAALSRRQPASGVQLAWAGLAVTAFDPMAITSAGAWLSFGAVAALLFALGARVGAQGWWTRWGKAQWVVFVGLAPITLMAFASVTPSALVANVVAVPWVSLVTVPLALLGTLCAGVPAVSGILLALAELSLAWLWPFLDSLAALGVWRPPGAALAGVQAGAAVLASVLVLMPRGVPGRWIAVLLLAFALWPRPSTLGPGEVRIHLLDVGQGLAAVLETRTKVLVYDTGARFGPRFDAGSAVVAPFLRSRGWPRVDVVLISHADNDHRGGYRGLAREIPVAQLISNVRALGAERPCRTGDSWRWDGVEFIIRHPPPAWSSGRNDGSCVLQVRSGDTSALFPGDLERRGEAALVAMFGSALRADVLVAPHHGSATSSSTAFLSAVRPSVVLIPAGYRNRYRMPHAPVLERLAKLGVTVWQTGRDGALGLTLGPRGIGPVTAERVHRRRYYDRSAADR